MLSTTNCVGPYTVQLFHANHIYFIHCLWTSGNFNVKHAWKAFETTRRLDITRNRLYQEFTFPTDRNVDCDARWSWGYFHRMIRSLYANAYSIIVRMLYRNLRKLVISHETDSAKCCRFIFPVRK
jgi:hypothetical protein